ncbi:MAG: ABC transporter substrate-binding protein [Bacteroidota bacterium]
MNKLLLSLSFLLLLAACSGDKSASQGDALQVFRYNQHNPITSLDPAFARSQTNIWGVNHLFNGLVQLDDGLNVQPCIAKRWTVAEDGKTYTFALRDDVYFHDDEAFAGGKGRRVVASDVAYSFGRIIDGAVGSPGSWIFKGRVAAQAPFQAPNDSTFVLQLAAPFRPMLSILTMQYCSIVPKEAVDKYGRDFRSQPVGTGPFKMKRWLENQALFLEKNLRYFETENGQPLPHLDGVRISFINDRKTAYLELINNKLDLISGLESSYINELLDADGNLLSKHQNSLQFLKTSYLNMEYLGINIKTVEGSSPLANQKIRQALNYGFDRQEMLRSLRNGVGKPAVSGITPRGLPSFDDKKVPGYTFNTVEADRLLKEAGFPRGEGLSEITLLTTKDYLDLCTYITKEWEEWIGIKVNIEMRESALLREMMSREQAPFFRASWIADYPDAESFLTMFYSKNPAPPNYTRYSNPKFDQLYEAALAENNDQRRYELYQQMDLLLIEDAPLIFMFYDETALFANKSIKGLSRNAINLLNLKRVKK